MLQISHIFLIHVIYFCVSLAKCSREAHKKAALHKTERLTFFIKSQKYTGPWPMQEVVPSAVRAAVRAATITLSSISQILFFFMRFCFCRVCNLVLLSLSGGQLRILCVPLLRRAAANAFL